MRILSGNAGGRRSRVSHKYTKKDFLTIPNALSLFRLCLVPLLIWVYCVPKEYIAAVCIIALSALTDIVDGKIARKLRRHRRGGRDHAPAV